MPEKTNDKYPVCRFGSRNCHAYANERCMALESLDPKWKLRCPFYKSNEQYEAEDEKALARLREKRMTGRLEYYRKPANKKSSPKKEI